MTDEIKVGDEVEVFNDFSSQWKEGYTVLAIQDKDPSGSAYRKWYVVAFKSDTPRAFYFHQVRKPAPKPVVEEVVMCGGEEAGEKGYYTFSVDQDYPETHKIAFNIVDGVPDCNSIRMEKL